MTAFVASTVTNTSISFVPGVDTLRFDAGSAAQLRLEVSGADLLVGVGLANIRLLGVGFSSLVDTSLNFDDGSLFRPGTAVDNVLFGFDFNDYIDGDAGNDYLDGGLGNDYLTSGAGNDTMFAGEGNDTLIGGSGFDSLYGEAGDDTYIISSTTSYIVDDAGNDTAIVSASFAKLPSTIEQVSFTNGALALPYWIDALLPDAAAGLRYQMLLGAPRSMQFAFPAALPDYNTDPGDGNQFIGFNETQKAFARVALAYVSTVVGIGFTESLITDAGNTIAFGNNSQAGSAAYAYFPSESAVGSDVFLDRGIDENLAPADGLYAALTLIHELGHALGLKHPFAGGGEGPYLMGADDDTEWTVMSYTDHPAQYHLAYSPLDIAALQYLYGPSSSARAANDSYQVSATTANFVWDGAGQDTLSASGLAQAVTLSLEPGYWGYVGSQATTITGAGQVTVNFGSVLENLVGGLSDDNLSGNAVANMLAGGQGGDTLGGGAGNDTLDGGSGFDTAVFSGVRAAYAITRGAGGTTVTGADGSDLLLAVEKLRFTDQTVFVRPPDADFDGDGRSDILFRNSATGGNMIWKSANSATVQSVVTEANQAWKVVGVGDFQGDGKADILWRNSAAGQNYLYNSGVAATGVSLTTVADLNWKVAGVGDFDADGKSDILWRNTSTGANTIWKSGSSATVQTVATEVNQAWQVAGVGDFQGDGKSDILWRNSATGQNYLYNSGNAATGGFLTSLALEWKVAGVGDFDGDSKGDILWRNTTTGANTVWKSANSATVQVVAAEPSQDWQVAAVADYQGDGLADILWRNNSSGENKLYNSGNAATTSILTTLADLNWKVQPGVSATPAAPSPGTRVVSDFDFDGKSDILWRNTATGADTIWKSGNSATVQAVATETNQAWQVAGVGDFQGDGKADILWRNYSTGQNYLYNAGVAATGVSLTTLSDLNWKIAGVGDFDADGKSDILWRNASTGANTIWKSGNNATVQTVVTETNQAWQVAGVGDFQGDGRADILWRNSATGQNYLYNSGNAATGVLLGTVADQNWKIVGVGDFDGDGKSDILWRNTATGANTIWKSGNSATVQTVATEVNQAWQVVGVGDFQGDGKADILWRNSATGQNYLYNAGNAATGGFLGTQADLNWRIIDGLESGDLLAGGAGNNRLYGTVRSDVLVGAAGADTLTGGPGADVFRYLTGAEGTDSITDFVAGMDKLQLVSAGFANLAVGALNAGNFVSGAAPVANSAVPQFLYTTTTGLLAFDADGTGGGAAIPLVTLVGQPVLTAADLVVA